MVTTQSAALTEAARVSKISRNKTVSTKLTESECTDAERAAAARGQWLSEWVRDVIMRELKDQRADFDLICEIVGLQLLLMNVLAPLARGEKITADQFQAIVKSVQTTKSKAAEEMLSRRHPDKEL
ncbi:MAG TPA: hypothetical protein VGR47_06760 [Terracidiphilus sp.]|nr:hypothetical protein [Terracidiphilus sp.]